MKWDENGNAISPSYFTPKIQSNSSLLVTKLKWELCESQKEVINKSLQLHLEQVNNFFLKNNSNNLKTL